MAHVSASGQLQQQLRNSSSVDVQTLLQNLLLVLEQSSLCDQPADIETSNIPNPKHLFYCHGMQHTVDTSASELSSCGVSECSRADGMDGSSQGHVIRTELLQIRERYPSENTSPSELSSRGVSECGRADGMDGSYQGHALLAEPLQLRERYLSGAKHRNTLLTDGSAPRCSESKLEDVLDRPSQIARQLRVTCLDTQGWNISWPVAVQRLQTNDKQIVSQAFEVAGAVFRLMLKPREMTTGTGKSGFRLAHGHGHVELKCEVGSDLTLADLHLSLTINGKRLGPSRHNFACTPVACLPREAQEWNFARAADKSAPQLFTVHVNLVPSM